MYGDSEVMRRHVGALREQAVDVRALADRLVAQTESIGWTGRAAESMSERVRERATHLRAVAADHETAADSLDRHAQDVAGLQEAIAEAERKVEALTADARARVARLEAEHEQDPSGVRREPDPDDRLLAAFSPPPSGHKDWLTVELPGL